VVLLDINKEVLEKVFGAFPQQAMIFGIDITDQSAVKTAVDAAAAHWGVLIF
jgi:NADP-dependent 3-hydroxy acid dehydrogenase YdfG